MREEGVASAAPSLMSRPMTLRELQYIVAVADTGNFSRAAEVVHVSQPTLSAQVRKLEDTLGVTIFERAPRRVLPTEAGEVLIASARRILAEADQLRDTARALRDPLSGRFRLGAIPTLAGYMFPGLMPEVRRALPELRLILVEEKTDELVARLREGRLDAALLALPLPDDTLEFTVLFVDRFHLAVPRGDPLAERKLLRAGELAGTDLLLLEDGHCLRDQSLEVCRVTGAGEEADFRATSLETLRQMVVAGTGRTLMPEIAMGVPAPGVAYVPFSGEGMSREVALAWRPTTQRRQVMDTLVELLKR